MSEWKTGSELSAATQQDALRRYVHRSTREHRPSWASGGWKDGKPYPLQFDNDRDWLCNTRFAVAKSGALCGRTKHCLSSPTWPDNPELRKGATTRTPAA